MVDLHCHILPGIDDGPSTLAESLEMLGIAARTGSTAIVATPHASLRFRYEPAAVYAKIAQLQESCGTGVTIYGGCEFLLDFDNIEAALSHPARYTINQGRYLLVELPPVFTAKATDTVLSVLRESGIVVVIAHPERNPTLRRNSAQLGRWIETGSLVQVTAQSLLGRFGSDSYKFARELMKRGWVHFVASDGHGTQHRQPRLDEAYKHVADVYGHKCAERLFVSNPRAAIHSEPLPEMESTPHRKWYQFAKA